MIKDRIGMSKKGIEALKKLIEEIKNMSDDEFIELMETAKKREGAYEKCLEKLNAPEIKDRD